ncbi:MAG: SRPBCC family protein [Burkholderiales bacterium]|nr:SRPBCC family protein [Bacteroidia bacterium]
MLFTLKTTQLLKSDIDTVWNFMSSPENLALITPKYMGFTILSDKEDIKKMYPGQIIHYYVTPVMGIKMNWVTEITHVSHHQFFVDEQRFGPYAFWHHKHFIKEVPGGIEMTDILHYKVPFGFIGNIVNTLFIRHKIKEIFDYRFNKLEQLFNHGK